MKKTAIQRKTARASTHTITKEGGASRTSINARKMAPSQSTTQGGGNSSEANTVLKQPKLAIESKEPCTGEVARKKEDPVPQKIDIYSLAASKMGIEFGSLLREMRQCYVQMSLYFSDTYGMSPEEGVAEVEKLDAGKGAEEILKRVMSTSFENLSWLDLSSLYLRDP